MYAQRTLGLKWERKDSIRKVSLIALMGSGIRLEDQVKPFPQNANCFKSFQRIYERSQDSERGNSIKPVIMQVVMVYLNSSNLEAASDLERQWIELLTNSRNFDRNHIPGTINDPQVLRALHLLDFSHMPS